MLLSARFGIFSALRLLFGEHRVTIKFPKLELEPLLIFCGLFFLYAYTTPRVIALYDDGQFILNSYFLSPTYPPGYPLYILISHLAIYLPFGSVAYKIHLVSALFGGLTGATLWNVIQRLGKDKSVALIAAIGFGLSQVFWSEALIAKCYTLHSWLFFSLLNYAVKIYQEHDNQTQLFKTNLLFFFLLGLAFSNHWPFTILYGIMFPYFLWGARRFILRHSLYLIFVLGLGLLPYFWMWWRGQEHLILNAAGLLPFDSFDEFLSYVRRDILAQTDHDKLSTFNDKLQYIALLIREWFWQYSPLGLPLIFVGVGYAWRNYDRGMVLNLILGWIIPQILILAKIDFSANYFKMNIFKHYPMISYGLAAWWFGLGIKITLEGLFTNMPHIYPQIGTGLILGLLFWSNFTINNRSAYDWTQRYAQVLFEVIPQQARVLVGGENNAAILGYYHLIERFRPDITLYEDTNFFNNLPFASDIKEYLQTEYLTINRNSLLNEQRIRKKLAEFIDYSERPLVIIGSSAFSGLLNQTNPTYGLLARILTDQEYKHYAATIFDQRHLLALERLFNATQGVTDPWTISEQAHLIRTYNYLAVCLNQEIQKTNLDNQLALFLAELGMIDGYLMCQNNLEQAAQHLEFAGQFLNSGIERQIRAEYYKYRGEVRAVRFGINNQVIQDFRTSLKIYPSPDNLALRQLLKIYALLGKSEQFYLTAREYLTGTPLSWYVDLEKILFNQKKRN